MFRTWMFPACGSWRACVDYRWQIIMAVVGCTFLQKHNHNSNTDEMYLKVGVDLISANVQDTCQRGDWWETI